MQKEVEDAWYKKRESQGVVVYGDRNCGLTTGHESEWAPSPHATRCKGSVPPAARLQSAPPICADGPDSRTPAAVARSQ
eukprot:7334022-Prymnesium_polylepis.2